MNKDKLIEVLNRYFDTNGDTYAYHLTRDKEAFEVGTMTFDDFEEWSEESTVDLADYILKEMKEN